MLSQVVQTMIVETARLNTEAVTFAAQSNAAEASNRFRNAMEVLVNLTAAGNMLQSQSAPSFVPRNVSSVPLEFPKEDSFCIYNSLLVFEPRVPAGSLLEFDVSYYSAIVLFNFALIYHQRAAATGALKFYRAADHMYLKGLAIIQNFPEYMDVDMTALQLTILNNQAHICLKLGLHTTTDVLGGASEEIRIISCMLLNFGSSLPQLGADMINQILINTLVSGPQCAPSA